MSNILLYWTLSIRDSIFLSSRKSVEMRSLEEKVKECEDVVLKFVGLDWKDNQDKIRSLKSNFEEWYKEKFSEKKHQKTISEYFFLFPFNLWIY